MKKYTYIIALLLALTTLVSCSRGTTDTPPGMQEASTDVVNYDFFVPDDWTVETSTGVITAKYSDSITVNVSMMAATAPDGIEDAAAYWDYYRDTFAATFTEWELISDEASLLDEHAAHRYVYTGAVGGSQVHKFMQTVCVKDGVVYLFTYTASPDRYDEYLQDAESMLEYFKFN